MKVFLLAVGILTVELSLAQPVITSISPSNTQPGELVTITGTDLATNDVFFGGIKAPFVNSSATLITVEVPAGALHGPITVLNNNKIAESSSQFFVSFGGTGNPSFFPEYVNNITNNESLNAYDICLCDINGDNLNDVVITHNNLGNEKLDEFTYFINKSTPGTIDLGTPNTINLTGSFQPKAGFIAAECGDLDNNGDNEFVFISAKPTVTSVFIFDSITSTIPTLALDIPRAADEVARKPSALQIHDINGDGFKDIIIGNATDNTIHIFENDKSGIGFKKDLAITVEGLSKTSSLKISDLNNDQLPDIVILPFGTSNEKIYLLKNNSLSDSISFLPQIPFAVGDTRRNLKTGDFDNDGFEDLAITADASVGGTTGDEKISIFRNTSSTNGDISFDLVENISIPKNLPFDLDVGDLNGDGYLDIALTNQDNDMNSAGGSIYMLVNDATGSISFKPPISVAIAKNANSIRIGDLDGDGKPDLAYASGIVRDEKGSLGVLMNRTCIDPFIKPTIEPNSNLVVCEGSEFTLSATNTPNGVYDWTITPSGVSPALDKNKAKITLSATNNPQTIKVKITQPGCASPKSDSIKVSVLPATKPQKPTIVFVGPTISNGNVCEGEDFDLKVIGTYESYRWTLPDGSESTERAIEIKNSKASDAGTYSVIATPQGGCASELASNTVTIETFATPIISNSKKADFCADVTNKPELKIEPIPGGSYQWELNGSDIQGQTNTSLSVSSTGAYSVKVTNQNGCQKESGIISLRAIPKPVSSFSSVTSTCVDLETPFSASSDGEPGFTLEYEWRVDSVNTTLNTATTPEFAYTFNTSKPFDYKVRLKTSYSADEVAECSNDTTSTVKVTLPPTLSFNKPDKTQKCTADAIDLSVTNSDIDSYVWSTRNVLKDTLIDSKASTQKTLTLSTPLGVDSVYAIVSVLTKVGCNVKDSIMIKNIPTLGDITSPDYKSIALKDTAKLEEDISIKLSAVSIESDFKWEPASQIDKPNSSSITFFPQNPSTPVILTGKDDKGCLVSSKVTVIIDNIRPKKTFSHNGDGINDCWEILNIGDLGDTKDNICEILVFDARGRNIVVIREFNDDNCVWDGNFKGSPVPEGIYYFVLKCSKEEFSKSGSILLAR